MPSDPTDIDLYAASRARDALHAVALTMQLGLAAQTHPEEIRKALAAVFDLSLWESAAARIEGKYAGLITAEQQRCQRSLELEREVAALRKEVDALRYEQDEQRATIGGIRQWARTIQATLERIRQWAKTVHRTDPAAKPNGHAPNGQPPHLKRTDR